MEKLKKIVEKLNPNVIEQLLINLRYLIKHVAFKEEQECRIIKILPLAHKDINPDKEDPDVKDYKIMYVKYEPQVFKHVEEIYFGPKATGIELFQDFLINNNLDIPVKRSKNYLA